MGSNDQFGDGVPRAADLFCGAGGASLGMLEAGFDVGAAIDVEESPLETHEHNLAGETTQHDLSTVDADLVGDVDYLHASPPCKGFSTAGKMDSDDARNDLLWTTLEWIDAVQPTVATIENVPEAMTETTAQRLRAELDDAGYTPTWSVVDAADFGVPQHRHRLYVMAVQKGAATPSMPSPTHGADGQQTLGGDALEPWQTVGDVLHEAAADGGTVAPNSETPDHSETLRERFAALEPGQRSDATEKANQQRLDPERPAPTITGQPRDYIHPYEPRVVSVREMAALQSFPAWFEFRGRRTTGGTNRGEDVSQAEQAGNAVPPALQYAIVSHVRKEVLSN